MTETTWFRYSIASGVDGSKPGIYEINIEGVGCYIGECANERRPECNYADNMERMIAGRPPRNGKAFRAVHHAMLDARRNDTPVSICMTENVEGERAKRTARQNELIDERRREAATNGLRVFNATRRRQ